MYLKGQYFKIPVILLALIMFASCSGIGEINVTSVDNFKIMGIDDNIVTFSADIGVSNPSAIGFRVREINVAASADGIYIGNLINTASLKIPAQTDSVYNMIFDMRLSNMLSTAGQLISLSHKDQVNVGFKGYIRSTSGLISRKTNIEDSRTVDVPQTGFF